MDNRERITLKDLSSNDLFSALDDYLKKTITRELERSYDKKVDLLNGEEPWVFQVSE